MSDIFHLTVPIHFPFLSKMVPVPGGFLFRSHPHALSVPLWVLIGLGYEDPYQEIRGEFWILICGLLRKNAVYVKEED